ncbi:MAG: CvpA family protein [Pirellulales bacterium]|nr:CvpA family protein [Pirellulales bacterium]
MVITIILCVILLACVASLFNDGLWSNAVRLINVIFAALLSMNFFEPLAGALDKWNTTYTFVWDFLALWSLFVVFSIVLKLLTDKISQVKVKFLKIVDQIGGLVFSVWIGWVMICFTLTTLHTAPLSRDFAGFAVDKDQKMFLVGPDRLWLAFTQKQSLGVYGHSPANEPEKYVFDPQSQFMLNYHYRRAKLESKNKKNDSIRIGKNEPWWVD